MTHTDSTYGPGEFIYEPTTKSPAPLENWKEVLAGFDYTDQTRTITNTEHRMLDTPSEDEDTYSIIEAIKEDILLRSERLLDTVGHTAMFTGRIYLCLLHHIRAKFLNGNTLGLSEAHHLDTVRRMLPVVEKRIAETPGMVDGMVKYGSQ